MTEYQDTCTDCRERADAIEEAEAIIASLRQDADALLAERDVARDAYHAVREMWQERHGSPLVYICGPYRGDTADNVINAATMWRTLAERNIDAICPHTIGFLLDGSNALGDEWWLSHTKRLMLACTHIVQLPGLTRGMAGELDLAAEVGIQVFYAPDPYHVPQALLDTLAVSE